MLKRYAREFRAFLTDRRFVMCVALVLCLAFGFAAMNMTIGIDDLESDRYFGRGQDMLAAGRFTMAMVGGLVNYGGNAIMQGALVDILSMLTFAWAAINFCILFRRICGERIGMGLCTVFACVFVSYPLVIEIWEYNAANLCVGVGYVLASLALLAMHEALQVSGREKVRLLAFASIALMFVCAGYESLTVVYIFGVFMVLALQAMYGSEEDKKLGTMLRRGIVYAAVLVAGVILRLAVHRVILLVGGIAAKPNGHTKIYWLSQSPVSVLKSLIVTGGWKYGLKAMIYFPITEFVLAAVVLVVMGIAACRRHGAALLLPGAGMLVSLYLLSILQGGVQPYRTCQVFSVFVAFVVMFAVLAVSKCGRSRCVAYVLCACLCLGQAAYVNYFLTLNHVRSEEEAFAIRTMGRDLYDGFDLEKKVVFVGEYKLSDAVTEAASIPEDSLRWQVYSRICHKLGSELLDRKLPETNVSSALDWGKAAFNTQDCMLHLFNHYGYDYIPVDTREELEAAKAYALDTQMPVYPQTGYIADAGEIIVVNMG